MEKKANGSKRPKRNNDFVRELTEEEKRHIVALSKRKANKDIEMPSLVRARVAYNASGSFLAAIVTDGRNIRIGITKRNPTDSYNIETGKSIALARAMRGEPLPLSSLT